MESIVNSLNTVFLNTGNEMKREKHINDLRECLRTLITEENKAQKSAQAMLKIQDYLSDSILEGRVIDNMEKLFDDALKKEKGPKLNVEKHEMMAKFESRLVKLMANCQQREQFDDNMGNESEDEDNDQSIIDPITQNDMEDPVKNTKCGHSYERASIKRLLKKPGMLCPVEGCQNPLDEHDMEDDVQLSQIIQKQKALN